LVVSGPAFIKELIPDSGNNGPFAFWEKNEKFRELLLTEEKIMSPEF
jgi:hypothetical protein